MPTFGMRDSGMMEDASMNDYPSSVNGSLFQRFLGSMMPTLPGSINLLEADFPDRLANDADDEAFTDGDRPKRQHSATDQNNGLPMDVREGIESTSNDDDDDEKPSKFALFLEKLVALKSKKENLHEQNQERHEEFEAECGTYQGGKKRKLS